MKCAVLVSGGVDSSVALRLAKDAGYNVTAFYIKIWLEDELSFLGNCPWQEDLEYVQKVCQQLSVPLEVISLQREYWDRVVSYTIDQVKAGRTPNPDVLCNQQIKFGAFCDAIDSSYQKIATGHYAGTETKGTEVALIRSPDAIKDQTYFLAFLNQSQLQRAYFPLAPYDKSAVRALARSFDLPNKDRKDSQGICFLGAIKFDEFLEFHLGKKPGKLIEVETGAQVGEHQGFWFYTIGQRKGIRLSGGPWYVVKKEVEENIVYVSRTYYSADKARDSFFISSCNWIGLDPAGRENLYVKVRHGAQVHACKLQKTDIEGRYHVVLESRDQGIAAGQFAVFYSGNYCVGAGIIDNQ